MIPIYFWKLWDRADNQTIDTCDVDDSSHFSSFDDGGAVNKDTKFPIKIGPFDITDHRNCKYEGENHDTVGQINYDGFTISCKGVDGEENVCRKDGYGTVMDSEMLRVACAF